MGQYSDVGYRLVPADIESFSLIAGNAGIYGLEKLPLGMDLAPTKMDFSENSQIRTFRISRGIYCHGYCATRAQSLFSLQYMRIKSKIHSFSPVGTD
jgi:hypothetical protein